MVLSIDVCITLAVWVELFFYGIYATFFCGAISILLENTTPRAQMGAIVFLYTTLLMFAVATAHMALSVYTFLKAYILLVDDLGGVVYFFNFQRWDGIANFTLFCIMIWLGDALVIYRCYLIWNRNFVIIALPAIILTASIGFGILLLLRYSHPYGALLSVPKWSLNMTYPLAVVQNTITTGLIGFKIWNQHRLSSFHGIVDRSSSLSLMRIFRIIIESAMIYLVQIIALMILYLVDTPLQFIVQYGIVPSIGIVFVFITLRVHNAKLKKGAQHDDSNLPQWLDDGSSVIEFSANKSVAPGGVLSFKPSGETPDSDDNNTDPSEPNDIKRHSRLSYHNEMPGFR